MKSGKKFVWAETIHYLIDRCCFVKWYSVDVEDVELCVRSFVFVLFDKRQLYMF